MTRLPTPGGDDGTWGALLNEFLNVEHNADGTHRVSVNPDATTTSKGKIKLAGDLGGTADSPTVPGLAGKANTSHTHAESDITGLTADLAGKVSSSLATTKGDLLAASAASTLARLGVGSDGQVLTADSSQSAGLRWAAPAASSGPALVVAASDASAHAKAAADYVCDGTDDHVQINAALAALTATGGSVTLTEGNFNIASSILIQQESTLLRGFGSGQKGGATQTGVGTRLNAVSGLTNAVILVQRAADDRPVYGITLRDFTIDGANVGTAVDGIHMRSNRSHIDHVHVHRCTGNGIRLHGYGSPSTWNTYDSVVAFCQMGDNALAGMLFDDNSADCHMVHTILYNNQDNVIVKGASQQITSCHTYNATRYNFFFDGGGSRTKIINCKIEGAGQHAINIDSTNGGNSDVQITGNGFSTNGDSADNTYDHIIIQGPSGNGVGRTTIIGNSFGHKASVTPNKARYGVNLSASCAQGSVVLSNSFGPNPQFAVGTSQFGTAAINNNGSTSIPAFIRNNANAYNDPDDGVINVKQAPYNARGNGSTDDTAAIQAALDAVPSTGGVVYLPPGRYKITASLVIQTDNTTLLGAGAGNRSSGTQVGTGSRLEADSTFTGMPMVKVQRAALDRTVYGVKFRDLAIDGKSFGSGVDGIRWESVRGELDNVAVHLCTGNGVVITGYASWPASDNRLIACDLGYNTGAGLLLSTNAPDNKVIGCTMNNNQDGLQTTQTGLQVDSCDFYSNSRYGAYLNNAGSRTRFTGCRFRLNDQHGLILDSSTAGFSDISVTGCGFDTNGIATTNTYDHLILTGLTGNGISRVVVTGCNFSYASGSSANKPRYAVNLSNGASQNVVVEANSFGPASHWGTKAVNNNGSSSSPCLVRANSGWLTESVGTATVAAGTTSITVAHGLTDTPAAKNLSVTPTNNMGAATKYWVNGVDATNFVINVDQSPGASSTAQFAWQAEIL